MDEQHLTYLLEQVASGKTSVGEAQRALRTAPFEDLGFAKVDHHRGVRQGVGEVVYGAGKTPEQIADIAVALVRGGQECVLATRVDEEKALRTQALVSQQMGELPVRYHREARILVIGTEPQPTSAGYIVVAAAGTSDLPVAEEAALTAQALGTRVLRRYDVGVSGIHRLLAYADDLAGASAVVAVAGMEGALASVVGGLSACPVIAVPTSVGYGASFNGLAALLSMLNSCASGVSVVNIDNGFGAGYQAHLICAAAEGAAREGNAMQNRQTITWNLTENATRTELLAQTLAHLTDEQRAAVHEQALAAGVPARHHHNIGEVRATIDALNVSDRAKDDLRAIYQILAEAEAAAHSCPVDQTHFHEVGDGARIQNTLELCLAMEAVNPVEVASSAVQTGAGTVMCAHGELAIPAPATAAIIARGIPTCERTLPGERLTPTSAAMVLHFVTRFDA